MLPEPESGPRFSSRGVLVDETAAELTASDGGDRRGSGRRRCGGTLGWSKLPRPRTGRSVVLVVVCVPRLSPSVRASSASHEGQWIAWKFPPQSTTWISSYCSAETFSVGRHSPESRH